MLTAHEARDRAIAHSEHNTELLQLLKEVSSAADDGKYAITIKKPLKEVTKDTLMALGYDLTIVADHTTIVWY